MVISLLLDKKISTTNHTDLDTFLLHTAITFASLINIKKQ
jgi:hypothetical protein